MTKDTPSRLELRRVMNTLCEVRNLLDRLAAESSSTSMRLALESVNKTIKEDLESMRNVYDAERER